MLYRGVATGILRHHGSDAADDLSRGAFGSLTGSCGRSSSCRPAAWRRRRNSLNLNGQTFQAQARPFDALLRGLATEVNADWAERSAIFLVLCRQLGLDAGLIAVVPPTVGQGVLRLEETAKSEGEAQDEAEAKTPLQSLACGVLIDGRDVPVRLPDRPAGSGARRPGGCHARAGRQRPGDSCPTRTCPTRPYAGPRSGSVPGPGTGLAGIDARLAVATDEAPSGAADRREPDGPLPEPGRGRPRLRGGGRVAAGVGAALGDAAGGRVPPLPRWPVHHGDAPYPPPFRIPLAALAGPAGPAPRRHRDGGQPVCQLPLRRGLLESDGKTPIPAEATQILNLYATQFLALAQAPTAAGALRPGTCSSRRSSSSPSLAPASRISTCSAGRQPHNLGRLYKDKGQPLLAVRYYSQEVPTSHSIGDRLRAPPFPIWSDPFVPSADLPSPPPPPAPMSPVSRPGPTPAAPSPHRAGG